jgi:hypothetical protein
VVSTIPWTAPDVRFRIKEAEAPLLLIVRPAEPPVIFALLPALTAAVNTTEAVPALTSRV